MLACIVNLAEIVMSASFSGFPPSLLSFLSELVENNNRPWFQENKQQYEADVLSPALDFIAAMAEPLAEFAPRFVALPKRVGGSLMRVYRDTRFARDKRPYKTNVGIQFRHELGKGVHAPGYYFHIDPNSVFVGVGSWHPAADALAGYRQRIVDKPTEWIAARDAPGFKDRFRLAGDSLKRPPRGFDGDHPQINDIKRKDFMTICDLDHGILADKDLATTIAGLYKEATPFMRFLCKAINVPF